MIRNTRRSVFAMIAVVSMTLALPSYAQVATGAAGRLGPSASQEPCSARTLQQLQDAMCQVMSEMADVKTQLAQSQADLLDTQSALAETQTSLAETQASLAETKLHLAETRLELAAAQDEVIALRTGLGIAESDIASLEVGLSSLDGRLDPIEANPVLELGAYVRVEISNINDLVGPHILFTGANVHIRSGSGATTDGGSLTGLGNLIVGYNESNGDVRTGSHNLVIGRSHSYTSYGGLVAGFDNAVTGQEASVLGGKLNTASGTRSSISGGSSNVASGPQGSITGGSTNIASGINSSVTGGLQNQAISTESTVTGGRGNKAGTDIGVGAFSVVGGGAGRTAPGDYDWTAGSLFEGQ